MVNRLWRDEEFQRETELRSIERAHVRKLKDALEREGYQHRMSFYGTVIHKETGEIGYRRIEIFKQTNFTEMDYWRLEEGFKLIIPEQIYTLWIMLPNGKIKRRFP